MRYDVPFITIRMQLDGEKQLERRPALKRSARDGIVEFDSEIAVTATCGGQLDPETETVPIGGD